jgi:selenocysteine lyase/cysteine desulfurase
MPGLMAFAASLQMFVAVTRRHGDHVIADRVLERSNRLRDMLVQRGGHMLFANTPSSVHGSGIVTFEVPDESPADFRARAINNGVVVSCRGGGVRASVHVYNDDSDLQRLADLIPISR